MADARADTALGQLYIGVRPQPFVAGLGYWIVPDAASGLATRAVQLGSTQALQTLGAARVEAWAAVNNQPSQRVLLQYQHSYLRAAADQSWPLMMRTVSAGAGHQSRHGQEIPSRLTPGMTVARRGAWGNAPCRRASRLSGGCRFG
jgi:hypothetical protein